jgi:two-component system phosphate regulon sensor histidine kinase PhoR
VRNEVGETIGTAAIFNDITEIRNVDKMKTAFVSTVSHELRTPLTSIKGFISTLLQDTEGFYDNETRHEFYTIIDTECDRLAPPDRRPAQRVAHRVRPRAVDDVTDTDVREICDKVVRAQKSYPASTN